jgi:hypothetical protein
MVKKKKRGKRSTPKPQLGEEITWSHIDYHESDDSESESEEDAFFQLRRVPGIEDFS